MPNLVLSPSWSTYIKGWTTYSLSRPTKGIVVGDMDSVDYNCLLIDIHSRLILTLLYFSLQDHSLTLITHIDVSVTLNHSQPYDRLYIETLPLSGHTTQYDQLSEQHNNNEAE